MPAGSVMQDDDVLAAYSVDRAMYCPAGKALALVHARETAQVQQVMQIASRYAVPVVPQGARSGLSGATNALDGCILLNLEKMDRILEIDAPNRLVVAQPGVYNADLSRAVAGDGALLSARPVKLGVLHHRWQRVGQIRRLVLRQVRRHHRLCARARGGAGEW
ncbi:MAG: FAD-binding oxidoreductase [Nocardioidaceae bacterium]